MVLPICAKLEEDIAAHGRDEEKEMFLSELGLHESGLDRLIRVCYDLLGLMSYLTAGEQEVRAWTIEKGTKAPQAAGKIHSDFERGFIRAEVIGYQDLLELGFAGGCPRKGSGALGGQGVCHAGRGRRAVPLQRIREYCSKSAVKNGAFLYLRVDLFTSCDYIVNLTELLLHIPQALYIMRMV